MPHRPSDLWAGSPAAAVLVPIKSFAQAKLRLAPSLPSRQRAALARAMCSRVLAAAAPLPVAVICDDQEVERFAKALGARVIREPGQGLNRAVTAGVALLAAEGVRQVTVAHGDLPLATSLASVGLGPTGRDLRLVTLVPDRRLDGTNVAAVPAGAGFSFAYGPGSFGRHLAGALGCGLAVQVLRSPRLAWDVDVPDDLTGLDPLGSTPSGVG